MVVKGLQDVIGHFSFQCPIRFKFFDFGYELSGMPMSDQSLSRSLRQPEVDAARTNNDLDQSLFQSPPIMEHATAFYSGENLWVTGVRLSPGFGSRTESGQDVGELVQSGLLATTTSQIRSWPSAA